MLVTSSGSPLLIAGQKIQTLGTFSDDFQRGSNIGHMPLGMGWTDLGELFPAAYDITRIYNGSAQSGDPYWKGKNGAPMAPDDDWGNYSNYSGLFVGGISGAVRNVGDGIYNYDVTVRMGGILEGLGGIESEATPLVGVNTASDKLGYGAWLVDIAAEGSPNAFVWLIGYMGNPPESFFVTHVGPVTHTSGQERDLTLKYRGTGFTVWLDGVQITNLVTYPGSVPIGSAEIPVHADHQNRSWAGFEYDQHITPPHLMTTTPAVLSYSHKAIT